MHDPGFFLCQVDIAFLFLIMRKENQFESIIGWLDECYIARSIASVDLSVILIISVIHGGKF